MKTTVLVSTLIAAALLATGCADSKARKEIADLRSEIRDHRFEYSNPKLEVSILKSEVLPATGEYDDPKVRVTGVVRQNGEYPIDTYSVQVELKAKFTDGSSTTVRADIPIKEKSGAFTTDATIYGGRKNGAIGVKAIELVDAGWWRPRDWKDFIIFKPATPQS